MNIRNVLLGLSVVMIAHFAYAGKDPQKARYLDEPITIDANLSDWQLPLDIYERDARLTYAIANDEANIYVAIKDPWEQCG